MRLSLIVKSINMFTVTFMKEKVMEKNVCHDYIIDQWYVIELIVQVFKLYVYAFALIALILSIHVVWEIHHEMLLNWILIWFPFLNLQLWGGFFSPHELWFLILTDSMFCKDFIDIVYQPLHWQANSVNIFELKGSGWTWPFLDY